MRIASSGASEIWMLEFFPGSKPAAYSYQPTWHYFNRFGKRSTYVSIGILAKNR
jgi:hypothetical protein